MAEFIIMAADKDSANPTQYKKGDFVEVRANSSSYGLKEGLPTFIIVKVPEIATMTVVNYLSKMWVQTFDYSVVNRNASIDGYRLRAFAEDVSASNLGGLTRDKVETFLTKWGCSIFSTASNEVVFDVLAFDAIKSQGFWEIREDKHALFQFSEDGYDEATGIHTIRIDYSASGMNPSFIETYIEGRGTTIILNSGLVIVFEITANIVFQHFKRVVKGALDGNIIRRRQYYLTSAAVDIVIDAGGTMTITQAQLMNYIQDRFEE